MRRLLVVFALLVAAGPVVATSSQPAAATVAFTAHGSVNQVYAYGLGAGTTVELLDATDAVIDSGTSDTAGAKLFRDVAAGPGYQVRTSAGTVGDLTVTDPDDAPPESWYTQQAAADPLVAGGFDYLTTRDGTKLSVNVTMPKDGSTGPWPVLVNYSGYDPSQPGEPPAETAIWPYQGYVVVGVNLRGTTCSGGTYEFMEDLVGTDGYDVVETVAKQSWSNGDVGLVGISYGGYSQLYVGATNPPHLDAISPLSPFSDTYSGILYPGGILNDGFAVDWATERQDDAKPKAHTWVKNKINGGDAVCAANQVMRLQAKPLLDRIHNTPYADHEFDYLNTETFVHKIKMPTFLSSSWQDEQTGGSAINLAPFFDPATKLYVNATNGTHVEPMAPSELGELIVFIDLYVGKRIPHTSGLLNLGAGEQIASFFGSTDSAAFNLPFNIWNLQPSYASALAGYEAQKRVRIRWENGTVAGKEGLPFSPAETRYARWPIPGITNEKLYLQPDGALASVAPTIAASARRASSSYTYDPTTKRDHTFDGGTDQMWTAHPNVHWNVLSEGNALSFLSPAYTQKVAYAGQGSVDLWLRSSAADTDLEATLTEVRPDGKEVFIQSGWLRASHRTEDPARSTELVPYQDHQAADASPLPAGQFTKVRVELFPFAHVIRPGSKLRLNIEAPGGNQPFWAFESIDGPATNSVGHSSGMPSRVVLPRLPSSEAPNVPATVPACSLSGVTTQAVSLRNQPCRTYSPDRKATRVVAAEHGPDLDVTWTAPAGAAPDSYTVTPALAAGAPSGASAPAPITVAGSASAATFPAVAIGVPLEFTVKATYGTTAAPTSDASLPAAVRPLALRRFTTWSAFVTRQLTDFTGSAPGAAVAAGVTALNGGQAAEDAIVAIRHRPDVASLVDPVTRLYFAYFERSPGPGGQAYWVKKRKNGTSLIVASNTFAGSNEFTTKYGTLTNRAFVEKVYRNVLGRDGDAGGITYWTNQLNARKKSRGQVMLNFSESGEFVGKSRNRVDVANVWLSMYKRQPTKAQLDDLLAQMTGGTTLAEIVASVLESSTYVAPHPGT